MYVCVREREIDRKRERFLLVVVVVVDFEHIYRLSI